MCSFLHGIVLSCLLCSKLGFRMMDHWLMDKTRGSGYRPLYPPLQSEGSLESSACHTIPQLCLQCTTVWGWLSKVVPVWTLNKCFWPVLSLYQSGQDPANTTHSPNAVLVLAQCHGRWANTNTAMSEYVVSDQGSDKAKSRRTSQKFKIERIAWKPSWPIDF